MVKMLKNSWETEELCGIWQKSKIQMLGSEKCVLLEI